MSIAQEEQGVACTFSVLRFDCNQVSDKHMEMERTEAISALNFFYLEIT